MKLLVRLGIILVIISLLFIFYKQYIPKTIYNLVKIDLDPLILRATKIIENDSNDIPARHVLIINEEGRNKLIKLMKKTKLIPRDLTTIETDEFNAKIVEYEFYIVFDSPNRHDPTPFYFTVFMDDSIDKVSVFVTPDDHQFYYTENNELYDGVIEILEKHTE